MALDLMENGFFPYPTGSFGNKATILGVDMSLSVRINNKKRYFNSWKRFNARIRRAFNNCRKKFFNQF